MKTRRTIHVLTPLFGAMLLLSSCAASRPPLAPAESSHLKTRELVLPSGKPIALRTMAKEYESFAKDGISDSVVQHRIDSAFKVGLLDSYWGARVILAPTLKLEASTNPVVFIRGRDTIRIQTRVEGLDSTKLYLLTSTILYLPRAEASKLSSYRFLDAFIDWVVYDPALGKAILGGHSKDFSTTFAVLVNIITQSDWPNAARKVGGKLAEELGQYR